MYLQEQLARSVMKLLHTSLTTRHSLTQFIFSRGTQFTLVKSQSQEPPNKKSVDAKAELCSTAVNENQPIIRNIQTGLRLSTNSDHFSPQNV